MTAPNITPSTFVSTNATAGEPSSWTQHNPPHEFCTNTPRWPSRSSGTIHIYVARQRVFPKPELPPPRPKCFKPSE